MIAIAAKNGGTAASSASRDQGRGNHPTLPPNVQTRHSHQIVPSFADPFVTFAVGRRRTEKQILGCPLEKVPLRRYAKQCLSVGTNQATPVGGSWRSRLECCWH